MGASGTRSRMTKAREITNRRKQRERSRSSTRIQLRQPHGDRMWFTVPGSTSTNLLSIPINPADSRQWVAVQDKKLTTLVSDCLRRSEEAKSLLPDGAIETPRRRHRLA